ncbi:MAG TPA: hypothetical protein VD884_19195 [Ohtaekwangia sp.]|nr:hypothetical protein [Ohtaekwangia sp.]
MIRKFTTYLLVCTVLFVLTRCNEDEAESPPKSSVTVDSPEGMAFETVFTFEIDQVNADNITLYPYGRAKASWGTVPVTAFEDGVAMVEFTYTHVGVFDVVVVTNNHTDDGNFKNTVSESISVDVTSDRANLESFGFGSVIEELDEDATSVEVTVPYNGFVATKAKATYVTSEFATVTVNGVEQTSETTEVDFTNPVVYRITSHDGSTTKEYEVTVNVTAPEQNYDIKTFTGTLQSEDREGRTVLGSVDNDNKIIVLYDTLGTPEEYENYFEEVEIGYEQFSEFAFINYQDKRLAGQKLNFSTEPTEITAYSQDSLNVFSEYRVYALSGVELHLTSLDLVPQAIVTREDFNITIGVLEGTNLGALRLEADVVLPPNTTLVGMSTRQSDEGAVNVPFDDGDAIDFTDDVAFNVTVHNSVLDIDYTVTYTVTVEELK